jgi:hypothetical protein
VTDRRDIPEDLANGLIFTLLKNLRPGAPDQGIASSAWESDGEYQSRLWRGRHHPW